MLITSLAALQTAVIALIVYVISAIVNPLSASHRELIIININTDKNQSIEFGVCTVNVVEIKIQPFSAWFVAWSTGLVYESNNR